MDEKSSRSRNNYLDYLKGLLILFVVYGHTIQYIVFRDNGELFFNDPIFKVIYIFHMPLFMAVSGFVSFYSIQNNTLLKTIAKRSRQLIIPIICWAVISKSVSYFVTSIYLKTSTGTESILTFSKLVFFEILGSFWFLWAVFASTVIVAILKRFNADRILFLALMSILVLLFPNFNNIYLLKYTFPFFCAGYWLSKNSDVYLSMKIDTKRICLGLLFSLVCFLLWNKETYIYISFMNFNEANYLNIIVMYISGFILSSTFVIISFSVLYKKFKYSLISELGKNSLAIYIVQTYIFIIVGTTRLNVGASATVILFISPFLAVSICLLTHYFTRFLCKYAIPSQLLFGRFNPSRG
jgi:fucose 4-O-acetylase-like acetyltransferase